jgi:prevent-host-death family protein
MSDWALQDAKARFSELVETTLKEGPQVVTKRGIATVVVVSIEAWQHLQDSSRPTLKALLLASEPRMALDLPPRGARRRRPRVAFG